MMGWFCIAEHFSPSLQVSKHASEIANRDRFLRFGDFWNLVVDGLLMSALQLHRGSDLLDYCSSLWKFHDFCFSHGEHYHSVSTIDPMQTWVGHWVDALAMLSRKIVLFEGRRLASEAPHCFTAGAVGTLLGIADGRFSEESEARTNPTERAEAVEEARVILRTLASSREHINADLNQRAGSWWTRRRFASQREVSTASTPPPPAVAVPSATTPAAKKDDPIIVSLTGAHLDFDPKMFRPSSLFLTISTVGLEGQKTIPFPLKEDQELIISLTGEDWTTPAICLRYCDDPFRVVSVSPSVHKKLNSSDQPLLPGTRVDFGETLSIAGYIVCIAKLMLPIEVD